MFNRTEKRITFHININYYMDYNNNDTYDEYANSNKDNPLNHLGFILSMNQMLYLFIAMWVYAAVPDKLVMVLAMIFGAHLLPFGWLYKSMSYKVMAIIIPIVALIVGNMFKPYLVGVIMIIFEMIFSILLIMEVKKNIR